MTPDEIKGVIERSGQPLLGLNNPRSMESQMADVGYGALKAFGVNPFGFNSPDDMITFDAGEDRPEGTPRYQTGYVANGAVSIGPSRALSVAGKRLIDSGEASLVRDVFDLVSKPKSNAFFVDDLGNALKLNGDDHAGALMRSGLATTEGEAYSPALLAKHKLSRVRSTPSETAIEIHHAPSRATVSTLDSMAWAKESPDRQATISYDLFRTSSTPRSGVIHGADNFMKVLLSK